ncbi:FAD-binding oxidoreductase [Chamaesiphon minutus]|uniref:FAD/FMN-dependent dehydrogenase n=1 Tax=Chamaesiphon minutus (strain ATCC 27169 / PCC 6605) TaxID=1173020 RepID=K9UNF3_CHAP6|nr:FAD-binding oxidoreductase [Chamaesiphon minutus]AFY96203.1 FAD/FMN-dependent dehydrogenase [Chamaesiphon minutus PCC 6605]
MDDSINDISLPIGLPKNVEELAELVAIANRDRVPVAIAGNSTKLDWGGIVTGAKSLVSTQKLDRSIAHAVGDLTVTVEAGIKFANLQEILAAAGQFLPLDPAYPDRATIGGIIATADAGSLRHRYGGVRDLLLGISFVRADGKIAKAGGRVVKNVAGYDMMKLFTGSYGTLGILTEVTLRVYPLPTNFGTVILTGAPEKLERAAKFLLASTLTPISADVVSTAFSQALELSNTPSLVVKFATIPESIAQQSAQLLEIGKSLGLKGGIWQGPQADNLWSGIQTGIWGTTPIGCKLGVKLTAAVETIAILDRATANTSKAVIHLNSGIGACALGDAKYIDPLRHHCEASGGFVSVLQAPVGVKQQLNVWGYRGNAVPLMQQIKQQFDPFGLLNPGRCF